jgi:hypothetical protein
MPGWLKAAITWFNTPTKTMLTFAAISAMAIFTPDCVQIWAGTYEWTEMHRVLEWGFFLGGSVFVLLSGIQALWGRGVIWMYLRHLPTDERKILGYYVTNNIRTHAWPASDSAASTLASDGILELLQSHTKSLEHGVFYYRLKRWIFKYLAKRPQLVS